ncbi:MAG TPA: Gar1/Naf1 family protein [Nitrososphaeraceae archaeon]|nr:Gar1/Naf1 family protein [Nitrososphaeraceae archaeon]
MKLNELGEVMHLSKSGRLIVRLQKDSKQIKSGQLLVDANGKRIGKVIEVIGPVNAPYASVAPLTDRIKKIIGTNVFNGGILAKRRDFRSHFRKQQKGFRRYNNLGENQQ